VIFEGLDGSAGGIFFAKALDELNFGVYAIIVANKTADKSDDHDGRCGGYACRSSGGP